MNRQTRTALVLVLALCAVLLLIGAILAATTATTLEQYVIGGGGGRMESGVYSLEGTIGQPVVGTDNAAPFDLCSGFWCGVDATSTVYLPVVVKSS
jgi:hypothetical protein